MTVENISLDNISSAFVAFTDTQGINMTGLSLSNLKQPLKFVRSEVEIIKDSQFINNSFNNPGGVISMLNSNLMIKNTNFARNTAAKGGAISFECTSIISCKLEIEDSNFTINSASIQGGAISYNYNSPNITRSNFVNNSAAYGNDKGSYPTRIGYVNSKASDNISIDNVGPGIIIPQTLRLALIDHDDQVMTLNNDNQILIVPQDPSISAVGGENVIKVSKGLATFDSISFEVLRTLKSSNFTVSSKVIDATKISLIDGKPYELDKLTVNFRD